MTLADVALWAFRTFGLIWLVGAVFLLRQLYLNTKLDRIVDALETMVGDLDDEPSRPAETIDDKGRERWLVAGGALTLLAGAAMLIAHRAALAILVLLVVQQMFYFVRQRRRERAASTPAAAACERPTRESVNGFYTALLLTVEAGWLYAQGMLA